MTELYQHAQKYNSQLQEYNTKMQGELQAANESVGRVQVRQLCNGLVAAVLD